jgi:hypothetical protein
MNVAAPQDAQNRAPGVSGAPQARQSTAASYGMLEAPASRRLGPRHLPSTSATGLATVDLAEGTRDIGTGDTPRQAVRAALMALGEPYASEMAAGVADVHREPDT